jgi:hypothetical protein
MKRLIMFSVGLLVAIVFGITVATSAFALPDLSVTLGGTYTLQLFSTEIGVATKLSSTSGSKLKGEGYLLILKAPELTSLGSFEAKFTEVTNTEGRSCNTIGTVEGSVITDGTYHLVYTSLAGSPQGLQLGTLFLPVTFEMECGKEQLIRVRGSALSSISRVGTEATELTEAGLSLTGNGAGVPTFKFWYNDAGVAQQAKLESNFGAGFVQAAEEIAEPLTLAVRSGGPMFVITRR